MEPVEYECNDCDYWSVVHGLKPEEERHKKCQRCLKRMRIYREWVEKQEGGEDELQSTKSG